MSTTKKRYENDSFGKIAVPKDYLWGAQTQRSLNNFNIGTCLLYTSDAADE